MRILMSIIVGSVTATGKQSVDSHTIYTDSHHLLAARAGGWTGAQPCHVIPEKASQNRSISTGDVASSRRAVEMKTNVAYIFHSIH